jgi:hypothetical protein
LNALAGALGANPCVRPLDLLEQKMTDSIRVNRRKSLLIAEKIRHIIKMILKRGKNYESL